MKKQRRSSTFTLGGNTGNFTEQSGNGPTHQENGPGKKRNVSPNSANRLPCNVTMRLARCGYNHKDKVRINHVGHRFLSISPGSVQKSSSNADPTGRFSPCL